ncbi:MAG: tetratricopeptide repeat protein [Candidatus Cryptobacteroides sp.]|uniref:tetratricopeptide repeat protein n=1 Tax=Candidatus Cryptobacteroides sp. TaxID=2952915 RepID=UPI002A7F6209|nr:tetratricopeptide repeat protein [Candidatus Cryptobacteroides sp.]MDY5044134.1 tetratricopeptide repeat protein [Candidatus Cryptobacteroides sp.]
MNRGLIAALSIALALSSELIANGQTTKTDAFRQAVEFYDRGMFERAESIFSEIAASGQDVMAKGYEALCAVRRQSVGNRNLADQYISEYPYSGLIPQIRFYNALNLFDEQNFSTASAEFARIDMRSLKNSQVPEFIFKQAYSLFELDEYDRAEELFSKAEKMPYSDYTAPSRYSLGYIEYVRKNFEESFDWFSKAAKDPRFTEQAVPYMIECRYMLKDYSYVISNGDAALDRVTPERKRQLARFISESYLSEGNAAKAREYYEIFGEGAKEMDDADLFYAGSVMYSTGDYKGAVDKFSRMTSRADSIGQIANYEMAYSYIKTGNKVAAMDAFKAASSQPWNEDIREDAHFNYAKLSFDLNNNPSVFNEYMKAYPGKKKDDIIYGYIALACLYGHDYAAAVDAYSNIDLLDSRQKVNYMKANYLRAHQLIEGGGWRDAVPLLKAASYYSDKRDPFNQIARYWLGESYFRSGQYDQAIDVYTTLYNNSALEGKPEGALIPYDLAYCYFKKDDYDGAAKWFDEYLASSKPAKGEDAAARRADCDFLRKDYPSAIKLYEAAIARFPYKDNLYPYLQAGIAYGLTGDKKGKVKVLSSVEEADPSAEFYPEAMYELGRAYVAASDNESAISVFRKLGSSTKDNTIIARSLIELGMISRNMSEYDNALDCYKKVIDLMPDTDYAADALSAIESIYQSEGRGDEFLDYAELIGATRDKTDAEKEQMYFNAAEQVFMTENYSKAISSLKSYLDRYPQGVNVAQTQYYLAECHRNLGQKELACDWYQKSLETEPSGLCSENATLRLAGLSFELEHFKDAYSYYRSLLSIARLDANRHTARAGMMQSAFRGLDYQEAIACADALKADKASSAAEKRQADYVCAKSSLSLGERDKAYALFRSLSSEPSDAEGAEATYMLIQDAYDQGNYSTVQSMVHKFAADAPNQSYWLAKAFIVLGDSFAEQENYAQAKATFESIRDGYTPQGKSDGVLDNVNMRLEKLKTLM